MKWVLHIGISIAILSALSSVADAHSGRTNASGCHNNTRTGDYHCHNSGSGSSSGGSFRRTPSTGTGGSSRTRPASRPALQSSASSVVGTYRRGNWQVNLSLGRDQKLVYTATNGRGTTQLTGASESDQNGKRYFSWFNSGSTYVATVQNNILSVWAYRDGQLVFQQSANRI